jgi:chemotaxis signal transduction protein
MEHATRTLQIFSIGGLPFGIFNSEIAVVEKWRRPAPLPHGPESVMGVVSIQGRMLTVLDLATFPGIKANASNGTPQHIVALRGDEQLALAVDELGKTIEIDADEFEESQSAGKCVLGVFSHDGDEISIINVKELFPSAIQGRERRHRQF